MIVYTLYGSPKKKQFETYEKAIAYIRNRGWITKARKEDWSLYKVDIDGDTTRILDKCKI